MGKKYYDIKGGHPDYWGKTPPFRIIREKTIQRIIMVTLEDKNGKTLTINKTWLKEIK